MNYCLYEMHFTAPVHIGDSETARSLERGGISLCADTLFSALCHTALLSEGTQSIDWLYARAKSSELLFTDLFPCKNRDYYIPKPYLISESKVEISSEERKKMKRLTHLPIRMMSDFLQSIRGEALLDISEVDSDFGNLDISSKVAVNGLEETEPYNVGYFDFSPDSALYGIIAYKREEDLQKILYWLELLSYSGIGGKVSAGYGKFRLKMSEEQDSSSVSLLKDLLRQNDTNTHYISMTTALPTGLELPSSLDGATYSLKRRGGFVSSCSFAPQHRKKHTQYFFSSGSVFQRRFSGDIYDVGSGGLHPVYRYAKPLFLGVKL